jgi:hypothetical protein
VCLCVKFPPCGVWVVVYVWSHAPSLLLWKHVGVGSGGGGLVDTLAAFQPDQVQFAGLRVTAIDRKGARTSTRAKLVYIVWTGPEVKIMVKTRTMSQKVAVSSYFSVRGFPLSWTRAVGCWCLVLLLAPGCLLCLDCRVPMSTSSCSRLAP